MLELHNRCGHFDGTACNLGASFADPLKILGNWLIGIEYPLVWLCVCFFNICWTIDLEHICRFEKSEVFIYILVVESMNESTVYT